MKKLNPNWTDNGQDTCRVADNDDLKHSLRSVEKYAPWINKIYILTDNQKPAWLNLENDKIKIIDHQTIIDKKYLPCFNSNVIESHLHRIKGLSEHFLYSNDDMMFGAPVSKDFFFTPDGKPYARLYNLPAVYKIIDSPYLQTIVRMARAYQKRTGKSYYLDSHHNIDAYTKDILSSTEKLFADKLHKWRKNTFRTAFDFQRILFLYHGLGENKAVLRDPSIKSRKDSILFRLSSKSVKNCFIPNKYKLFCINDNEKATDNDRKWLKKFYHRVFPNKSEFER